MMIVIFVVVVVVVVVAVMVLGHFPGLLVVVVASDVPSAEFC